MGTTNTKMARKYAIYIIIASCLLGSFAVGAQAFAQAPAQSPPQSTMVTQADLEALFRLLKLLVYIGGAFIAVLAIAGIVAVRFCVREADKINKRNSDAVRKLVDDMRSVQEKAGNAFNQAEDRARVNLMALDEMIASQNRIGEEALANQRKAAEDVLARQIQLLATVQEQVSKSQQTIEERLRQIQEKIEQAGALAPAASGKQDSDANANTGQPARTDEQLIREVLASSEFEWTTIGRLETRTGLTKEEVMRIARSMADVQVGRSQRTQETILKIKR